MDGASSFTLTAPGCCEQTSLKGFFQMLPLVLNLLILQLLDPQALLASTSIKEMYCRNKGQTLPVLVPPCDTTKVSKVSWRFKTRAGEKMCRIFSYWNAGSLARDRGTHLLKRQNGQVRKPRVMNQYCLLAPETWKALHLSDTLMSYLCWTYLGILHPTLIHKFS